MRQGWPLRTVRPSVTSSYLQNTVDALARAVDAGNGYTHLHSHAVASYAVALARDLGMDEERIELIRRAGVLHDVGKIGVPDSVL